jgi:hypothetical protein
VRPAEHVADLGLRRLGRLRFRKGPPGVGLPDEDPAAAEDRAVLLPLDGELPDSVQLEYVHEADDPRLGLLAREGLAAHVAHHFGIGVVRGERVEIVRREGSQD